MPTITVSAGRAIGYDLSTYLPPERWDSLREEVRAAVDAVATEVYFEGTGTGYWYDDAGNRVGSEDSYTVVASVASEDDADVLSNMLSLVAWSHQQEAIALTVGETHMVVG